MSFPFGAKEKMSNLKLERSREICMRELVLFTMTPRRKTFGNTNTTENVMFIDRRVTSPVTAKETVVSETTVFKVLTI